MHTITSFWYTPKGYKSIGLMEILTIKSWLDNGYIFELYTYNLNDRIFKKFSKLFENFKLKDANEIVAFENYFSDNRGAGVAAFSDYFRFKLLYDRGGIWVDLDMICLNYTDLNQEYIFSQELDEDKNTSRITTSFLKFPKNSDFGKNLIQKAERIINNKKIIPWGIIGPNFLAQEVKKWELEKYAWDYKKTCQFSWYEVKNFTNDKIFIDNNQPFLHLFSEMWRVKHMKKDAMYNENSIYSILIKKYEIKNLLEQLDYKISFYNRYIYRYIFNFRNFLKI